MKKIMLTVIAGAMLLSNVAFASTKTDTTTTVSSSTYSSGYHINTTDPH